MNEAHQMYDDLLEGLSVTHGVNWPLRPGYRVLAVS